MDGQLQSITWEAPEHVHYEKSSDWYWALWILVIAAAGTAIFLGNLLFTFVILLAGGIMSVLANRPPAILPYAITARGVRVDDVLYPYTTLDSYCIETEFVSQPLLILKSQKTFMSLITIPLPEEYLADIEEILSTRLNSEHLEEPFTHKLLEFFGF